MQEITHCRTLNTYNGNIYIPVSVYIMFLSKFQQVLKNKIARRVIHVKPTWSNYVAYQTSVGPVDIVSLNNLCFQRIVR